MDKYLLKQLSSRQSFTTYWSQYKYGESFTTYWSQYKYWGLISSRFSYNYKQIIKKCFPGTVCIVLYIIASNTWSHYIIPFVENGLRYTFHEILLFCGVYNDLKYCSAEFIFIMVTCVPFFCLMFTITYYSCKDFLFCSNVSASKLANFNYFWNRSIWSCGDLFSVRKTFLNGRSCFVNTKRSVLDNIFFF